MEEQSQQKKSAIANQPSEREWPNPRNASHANPWAFSVWMAKTPRKTLIHRPIHRAWSLTRLVHHTPIKREATGAGEVEAEAGVAEGAEATTRKENGIVFSTRKTMTTTRIIV
jgi:hypothetical protein